MCTAKDHRLRGETEIVYDNARTSVVEFTLKNSRRGMYKKRHKPEN
jgi:hypothetical protein